MQRVDVAVGAVVLTLLASGVALSSLAAESRRIRDAERPSDRQRIEA